MHRGVRRGRVRRIRVRILARWNQISGLPREVPEGTRELVG
jgi:hypothetical protein